MKGVIYTRVSSDEQVEGTSLASQDDFCRKYCEQKGIEVVAAFREEGQSAKDLSLKNRTQFLAALEFCRKENGIQAFVVFKVDRFARNTEDHFSVRRLLSTYGTSLYSVTEPIGDKPAEKFIETVLAGASEYDNAIRKQRCTDGMLARLNQGIWPFKPPIGYTCARHRARGEKKTAPDDPDANVFPLIQRALRTYASGAIPSITVLTQHLNSWGFTEARGSPARVQLVDRMLSRYLPFYAGILVNPWNGAETTGAHQPMISRDEMLQIRRRKLGLSGDLPIKRSYFNANFPLRRLLTCAECGNLLTGANSSGNGGLYAYYYCRSRGCSIRSVGIRASQAHDNFDRYVRKLIGNPRDWADVTARVVELLRERQNETDATNGHRDKQLAALLARRHRIFEMREDGSYDQEMFRDRLDSVDREIASVAPPNARELNAFGDLDAQAIAEAAQWFVMNIGFFWRPMPSSNRLRFERLAFPTGIIYARLEGCRTDNPGLAFSIVRAKTTAFSLDVMLKGFSSNQLAEYFEELLAFYHEMKDLYPEQADLDAAA
jgi:site-specific DNA recombinase